jgi:ribose 5-phosphate isomerase B
MRVAFAADHGGAELKDELLRRLADTGDELIDLGGDGSDPSDDYPDFARLVAHAVRDGQAERGILVCGSGIGASVAASKVQGVRAAIAHDTYSAAQGVEHDDMNVLCLGGRVIGPELALACARAFLSARYSGQERHARRLAKILAIEAEER